MSSKTKYPSKAVQVTCYYCEKTILKQNFKAHTETVHTGKPVREKVIGAAFDLFQLARKRNIVDEVEDEPANKQSRPTKMKVMWMPLITPLNWKDQILKLMPIQDKRWLKLVS